MRHEFESRAISCENVHLEINPLKLPNNSLMYKSLKLYKYELFVAFSHNNVATKTSSILVSKGF